jgi:hypothetical protein
MDDLALVASLFGPRFGGLIFHAFCIKFAWLRSVAVPIDRGALLRGRPLFGANKTYRGVLAVALGAAGATRYRAPHPHFSPVPSAVSRSSASPRSASPLVPPPC